MLRAAGTVLFFCLSVAIAEDRRNQEFPGFKSHFRFAPPASKTTWENRRRILRNQVLAAAGLNPYPARTPLHARVAKRMNFGDYWIESIVIEPLPGYFLGGNLYRPAGRAGKFPAVLVAHGHWKRGRLEDLPSYSVPALCVNLARQGYIAFAYDMAGYNDTRQTPHSFESPEHALWSFNPMGLQLWNGIRSLDYLQSLPDVDANRIAVTGASGGASQTIFLTAVDDRVKVAVPVNMISAHMQGGDPCEEAPGLHTGTSNVELAALAAPRPMLIVSCTGDWTRNTPQEEFPAIRSVYSLYDQERRVRNFHQDAEHNYNRTSREAVYRFLAEHLKADADAPPSERPFTLPADHDMLAFAETDLAPDSGSLTQLFESWKIAARMGAEKTSDPAQTRQRLRAVIGAELEPGIETSLSGSEIVISRVGARDEVRAHWAAGSGPPVLLLHPEGAVQGYRSPLAREILNSGRPLLVLDPFRPTRTRTIASGSDRYFLSYNRSDDAEQIQDILTALQFLKHHAKGKPELIGIGRAGIPALFAAAIAPVPVSLIADLNGFSGSDDDFLTRLNVPGIQRAGGLNAAMRLIGSLRATIDSPAN